MLQALPDFRRTPGIDGPCVTSGTELSVASALAESLSMDGLNARVFCLLEENECRREDFILEAERCVRKNIGNIIVIATYRPIERSGMTEQQVAFRESISELGWKVLEMEGCDFDSMDSAFNSLDPNGSKPTVIFTSLMSGRNISFAETDSAKNKKRLSIEAMDRALEELEGKSNG